jgi:putative membrane protein
MTLIAQVLRIAHIEAASLVRHHQALMAAVVVSLIPALYCLIYLFSVWDPASHTGSLAVALVNLDRNVDYKGQSFNVGEEVVQRLKANHTFGFQDSNDEPAVRQAVREGKYAFALIIPSDFSSNAVPGAQQGAGKLVVYTSEGNNYQSAQMARRFANDLGHAVNDSLNERRWDLVISSAAGSQRSVERLRQGVSELQSGARALETATTQTAAGAQSVRAAARVLDKGVDELTDGITQMGTGLRNLDAARPKPAELHRLQSAAEALSEGHTELGRGFGDLKVGAKRLNEGVANFREEASESILVPGRILEGLDQIHGASVQLDAGVHTAASAHQKLAEGATAVSTGVTALTGAAQTLGSNLHSVTAKLPDDQVVKTLADGSNQLRSGADTLADGAVRVKAGAQHLSLGMDVLMTSLPLSMQTIDGSAKGMSQSVQPVVELDAEVSNQGSSFAPNVIPAALWLGAGIIAFLFNVRVLPHEAQSFNPLTRFLGKVLVPSLVVLLQAACVLFAVSAVLQIATLHFWPLVAVLATASLTFLCIVLAMARVLGDAGKALAMLFLAVQLSSSGGVLPVELSGGLFAQISPWLPMTWVVQALKATMFGAYDDAWQAPLLQLALVGIAALACACLWGPWRYVDPQDVRPVIDF